MDLTAEKLENLEPKYSQECYTVRVGSHRILTIATLCHDTATKWIKEVEKFYRNKPGPFLVGLSTSTDTEKTKYYGCKSTDPKKIPYDLIQLCIGSNCLIYQLPNSDNYYAPIAFESFFANPNVIAVGVDMASVAKKLYWNHDIQVLNKMDVNELAVKAVKGAGGKKEYPGLERCRLDLAVEAVCGRDVYVVRPGKEVKWYVEKDDPRLFWKRTEELTIEKVKYATLDAYFSYRVGVEALALLKIRGSVSAPAGSSSSKKKKMKMNDKKKKIVNLIPKSAAAAEKQQCMVNGDDDYFFVVFPNENTSIPQFVRVFRTPCSCWQGEGVLQWGPRRVCEKPNLQWGPVLALCSVHSAHTFSAGSSEGGF
ncbi:hypothetical protein Vadar_002588 [Vaccinium darrowii]|uniref:Uncharacterized protein n=1 Tax=Vaccinium darrowii TaxID=229202 RepID=A0ACB7YJT3_9ERIC|nr:hypothetical protein Vadar_002588 [Vaccinium darrowii]